MSYRQGDETSRLPQPPNKPVAWDVEVTVTVTVTAQSYYEARQSAERQMRQVTGLPCKAEKPYKGEP